MKNKDVVIFTLFIVVIFSYNKNWILSHFKYKIYYYARTQ